MKNELEIFIDKALIKSKKELKGWIVFGIILILASAVFSYVTYKNIVKVIQPKSLALIVNQYFEKTLANSNDDIYNAIKNNLPDLIKGTSQDVISYIPALRKQLEQRIVKEIRNSEKKQKQIIENNIKEIFAQNKDLIIKAINDINSNNNSNFKKLADISLDKIDNLVKEGNEKSLTVLKNINKLLKKIKENKHLTPQEKEIKEFIQLFYVFQKKAKKY